MVVQTRRRAAPESSRSCGAIVRENLFTFVNTVIFALCLSLIVLGEVGDALVSAFVVVVNVLLGVTQEIRARRVLDGIALLTRPVARVVRDGGVDPTDPADLVVGDLVILTPGDQVVADGVVTEANGLRIDESLLTGESSSIAKALDAVVLAGSFCVAGAGRYRVQRVRDGTLAGQIARGARSFRRVTTPLQRQLVVVLRVAMLVALSFGVVLFTSAVFEDIPLVDTMRMAIVVAGLIPNGLFLAIAAAYALSAVRIARRGVLVQQANAIESLSHVTVLCLDKTGTLTTGRLVVDEIIPLGADASALRRELGRFAATVRGPNRTAAAIAAALPSASGPLASEVVFEAERRWSAVRYEDDDGATYILGAPDVLVAQPEPDAAAAMAKATAAGRRVLLFARSSIPIAAAHDGPTSGLPAGIEPLGIVSLRDELRPEVRTTLERFASSGVRLKLISGDHPETVRAIAVGAGIAADGPIMQGRDVEAMADPALGRVALDRDLFARVGPREKARLVNALRREGEVVAMIGDGINDVLALKASDLALSLQSGAQAARAVADLVLLDDSFAALPLVVREGQRIVAAMHDILGLFLTRVVFAAIVIAAVAMIGASFPFTPRQNALLSLMAVGLPSFVLAALQPAARSERATADTRSLLRSVLPAGWSLAMLGFVVYAATLGRDLAAGVDRGAAELAARSALVHLAVWSGLLLFAFGSTEAGRRISGARLRWGPIVAAVVLGALFAVGSAAPSLASLFDLGPVAPTASLALLGVGFLWLVGLRWVSAGLPRWADGGPAAARAPLGRRSAGRAHPGPGR